MNAAPRPGTIAVGSDERTTLTDGVVAALERRGLNVDLFGALGASSPQWPDVAAEVGARVARGDADHGLLFCWTGTGVSIAANKVPGIRAALCADAETARGARRWNDANVLCMSLRLTAPTVAEEIIDAWLAAEMDESERANIDKVKAIDAGGGG